MRLLLFSFFISIIAIYMGNAQSLETYKWKHRVILLVDDHKDSEDLVSQLKSLNAFPEEIRERDVLVFLVTPNKVYNENGKIISLDASKFVKNKFRGVLLIGKDGTLKLRKAFKVEPQTIFSLI
ncbi:MAG: DUF4174 domain-containing protein, partial [Bacteroidota bacterium]